MNNLNIVEALSQVAREKNVDREMVIETLTDALVSAAKKRYGNTENFEVQLDADTGSMAVLARKTVVEEVNEPELEIELEEARTLDEEAQLGSVVFEELNLADFGRNAIQAAKQILVQRVREAERERIYHEFSGRVAQIESGTVQQISHGDIVMNLGRAEAAIPLKEQIRRERYRQGDTIRGYIYEVLQSTRGPQVLLSRTHPEFLRRLFVLEVPEISEGIVEIHAVAREPGERAKIAVSSNDERVDPVGACVGVKGSRVQAIVRELSGERIDIVPWIDEPEVFIGRALSPATVSRVILDHRRHHASVIVDQDQLSLSIGRSGQNSRLAVQLTGWGLDIITDEEYQSRRVILEESQEELRRLPGVSELIALSLATSGFFSIRAVAESDVPMLTTVPGVEGEAEQLKQSAEEYVSAAQARGETLRGVTLEEVQPAPVEEEIAEEEVEEASGSESDDAVTVDEAPDSDSVSSDSETVVAVDDAPDSSEVSDEVVISDEVTATAEAADETAASSDKDASAEEAGAVTIPPVVGEGNDDEAEEAG